jgi:hypothetical protein
MKKTTHLLLLLTLTLAIGCTSSDSSTSTTSDGTTVDAENIAVNSAELQAHFASNTLKLEKPLPNIAPKPTTYRVNPTKENVLHTERGTTITIPKDAFVDDKGRPVKGEVEIAFQEYHTASDVILSGIPMHVISEEGNLEAFETAGMFDISGKDASGHEIRVAENKTLAIELATFKEEKNFNFYSLDKEKGEWKELYKNTEVSNNLAKAELNANLEAIELPERPIEVKRAQSSDFVFELGIDKAKNPEFKAFDNVLWKLTDNTIEDAQLFSETIRNPNLTCVDKEKSIFQLTGTARERKISARVQPVLFGSNWKKAQASFSKKLANFKEAAKNKVNLVSRKNKMADLQRNLAVNEFGTYNCDRYSRMKGRKKISFKAIFFVPAISKAVQQAYLIIKKGLKKEAVPIHGTAAQYFIYAPHENNTLITFDDDGNLFEFNAAKFEQLTAKNPRVDSEQTLAFSPTDYKITSERDLSAYLEKL